MFSLLSSSGRESYQKKNFTAREKGNPMLNIRTFKKARNKTSNHALICTSVQQCHSSIKHFPAKVYAWSVIFDRYFKFVSNKNSQTNWVSCHWIFYGPTGGGYCAEYMNCNNTLVSLECLWYSKHIAQFCRCCIFRNHRYKSNYAVWYCAILKMLQFCAIWNTDINQIMQCDIVQFCKCCNFLQSKTQL